jgi:hypothetical protein
MYKIKLISVDFCGTGKEILANNHDELRAVVTLAPEAGFSVGNVDYIKPLQTAQEFLEEIKDKIKPKDLKFGIDSKEGYELCEGNGSYITEDNKEEK